MRFVVVVEEMFVLIDGWVEEDVKRGYRRPMVMFYGNDL